MLSSLLALTLAVQTAAPNPAAAIGAMLRGDGPAAARALEALRDQPLSPQGAALRDCMAERLSGPGEAAASVDLQDRVVAIYQGYWRRAAADPSQRDAEEARLQSALADALGLPTGTPYNEVETALIAAMKARDIVMIGGRTGVMLDFMAWRTERRVDDVVDLPMGSQPVTIVHLEDFVSPGWSRYMTCGRSGTGGWVRPDGLYVVDLAYEGQMEDEPFTISFRMHEAQHFWDKANLPGLESWMLEYRAKLTELTRAETTQARLLMSFAASQGDDPADPHSYANARVLSDLSARLGRDPATAEPDAVRTTAAALLAEDTALRRQAPAATR